MYFNRLNQSHKFDFNYPQYQNNEAKKRGHIALPNQLKIIFKPLKTDIDNP